MQFKANVKVTGMKRAKGEFEGTAYDSTTVFMEVDMDESKGNAKGKAGQDYKIGLSTEYDKYASQNFPFNAEALFEIVTTGKQTVQRILSLTPLVAAKAA